MRPGAFAIVLTMSAALPSDQTPAQTPDQKPPDATAALSGVVVDGTTKEPVENANVIIAGTGAAGMAQTRQFTDAKGRFVFVNLKAGLDYTLSAIAPGYFPGSFSRDSGPTDQRTSIPLTSGQWVRDVRVTVWKPGSISGRVVDETNEPVVGVFVRVLSRVPIAGREQLVAGPIAITDDLGRYRIAGLDAGQYVVSVPSVQAPAPGVPPAPLPTGLYVGINGRYPWPPPPDRDGKARGYPITFHPAARSVSEAHTVEVRLTEERAGVDVALEPVALVKVAGTIQGPSTGLSLRLVSAGLESLGNGSEAAMAFIAADGSFEFAGVPEGPYVIDVRRRLPEFTSSLMPSPRRMPSPPTPTGGGSSATYSTPVQAAPPGISLNEAEYGSNTNASTARGRQAISVGAVDIAGVVVTLSDGASLSGTIEFDVEPAKPDARPASFLTALLFEPAAGQADLGVPNVQPQQGAFRLAGIPAGEFFVRLRPPAREWAVKSIMWNSQDFTHRPFDTAATSTFAGVVVTLTNRVARLTGTVKEANAAVILFSADQARWSNYGFNPPFIRDLFAGHDGTFQFEGMSAGDYFVIAVDPRHRKAWTEPGFFRQVAPLATRVSLDWGEGEATNLSIVQVRR